MQTIKKIAAAGIALSLTACATKQSPLVTHVSHAESSAMDCSAAKLDLARTRSVLQDIESTGRFDGRTVLGILGDFGIGNGLAKNHARQKATARLKQLEALSASLCQPEPVSFRPPAEKTPSTRDT